MKSPSDPAEPPEADDSGNGNPNDRVPPCPFIHQISTDFWGIIWCHCPRCRGQGTLCLAQIILETGKGDGG